MTKTDAIKVIEILEKKGNVTTEEIKEIVEIDRLRYMAIHASI